MRSPDELVAPLSPRADLSDRLVLWAGAAAVIALRTHVDGAALEADECNYLYTATRLLAGDRLYVDVWDHQPPGVFWMFAALCRVFGDAPATLRWAATAACVLTWMLLFDAARRSFGRRAAWILAALFAVGHVDPLMAGEGGNREVYMNALAAAAMWALLRRPAADTRAVLVAGTCFGIMSLLKTVAVAPWLGVTIAAMLLQRGSRDRARVVIAMGIGPILIWAFAILGYAATGRLAVFVDAAFFFNLAYSGGSSSLERLVQFFASPQNQILAGQWPVWVAGALGILSVASIARGAERIRVLWIAYAVGSYVAVCLPGRFWPHYYLLAWPPVVVLAAALCSDLADRITLHSIGRKVATTLFATPMIGAVGWGLSDRYLFRPAEQVSTIRYGERMEWAREQGRRVKSVTGADDTIYVWGSDVGVYYYGDRRCATRYTMSTALAPEYEGYEARRATLLRDLERWRPVFVLVPEPEFDELARLLMQSYFWVGEDRDPAAPSLVRARVFQRKDRFDANVQLPWARPLPPSD